MRRVGRAAAIAFWSIGAMGVATAAIAGDRVLFRMEPTTPTRVALIGLVAWLVIGWPMWAFDRLLRSFVLGQGAIVLLVASSTLHEASVAAGAWIVACFVAFGVGEGVRKLELAMVTAWATLLTITGGTLTLSFLRAGL